MANDVRPAIDAAGVPPGTGSSSPATCRTLEETKGYVIEAILLAVVFIYLILASLFGSFLQWLDMEPVPAGD